MPPGGKKVCMVWPMSVSMALARAQSPAAIASRSASAGSGPMLASVAQKAMLCSGSIRAMA